MKKRILNVACGNDTYGTDFVDLYPARKEVKKCNLEAQKLPYKTGTFDEVYSAFNFEHLRNPGKILKEMARVTKKGGKVIIKTNNAGFWLFHNKKSKVKSHYGGYEERGRSGGGTGKDTEDKHYALYTFHHMKNHFEESGLKVIKNELYNKGKQSLLIEFINNIIKKTRFEWMAYAQIKTIGIKK